MIESNKPLHAFIFDLDGVITDTAEYHYLAWKAIAEELEIPFCREQNEELKGLSRLDSLNRILATGGRQLTEQEKLQLASRKNDLYQLFIRELTPKDILPGIAEFIAAVKERGYKLGLASASRNAYTVMQALELLDSFDIIVDSGTIQNGKPAPEIYLKAAELLQADPVYCIGIEDAAAGVEAIKSAGMFAVGIGSPQILVQADLVVQYTAQLSLNKILEKYHNCNISVFKPWGKRS